MRQQLEQYLAKVFGEEAKTSPMRFPLSAPYLYHGLFSLRRGRIRGQTCVFAMDKGVQPLTPAQVASMMEQLEALERQPVVYVGIPSGAHDVARLLARGVPFVVPEKAVSLPFLALHLKTPKVRPEERQRFAGCEQMLVLGVLLKHLEPVFTVERAAQALPYSCSAILLAVKTLERLGFLQHERLPHSKVLRFRMVETGKALWDLAQTQLISPITRRVGMPQPPQGARLAGVDALAQRTFLAEEAEPRTFALWNQRFKPFAPDQLPLASAPCQLQLWAYPPCFPGQASIDSLSLSLSLRDDPDERVQQACHQLLEAFPWS